MLPGTGSSRVTRKTLSEVAMGAKRAVARQSSYAFCTVYVLPLTEPPQVPVTPDKAYPGAGEKVNLVA